MSLQVDIFQATHQFVLNRNSLETCYFHHVNECKRSLLFIVLKILLAFKQSKYIGSVFSLYSKQDEVTENTKSIEKC